MPALRLRGGQADGGGPGGAGMPAGLPGMPPGNYSSKVFYIVTLYRRYTRALTCENVLAGFNMEAMNSMFQNPAFQNVRFLVEFRV